MKAIKIVEKALFKLKYKLGMAQEGKDFFTCNQYDFCKWCTKAHNPCEEYKHGQSKEILQDNLKYVFCDDWMIYAIDAQKRLYYVVTEMWPEWLDIGDEKAYEKNAVKKYMLPIAKRKWNELRWKAAKIDGQQQTFSYLKHFLRRLNMRYYLYYRWKIMLKTKLQKGSNGYPQFLK